MMLFRLSLSTSTYSVPSAWFFLAANFALTHQMESVAYVDKWLTRHRRHASARGRISTHFCMRRSLFFRSTESLFARLVSPLLNIDSFVELIFDLFKAFCDEIVSWSVLSNPHPIRMIFEGVIFYSLQSRLISSSPRSCYVSQRSGRIL